MNNQSILIVDDFSDIRLLMRSIISPCGYKIEESSNGIDALEKIKSETNIGLVLLDIMMPAMNGLKTMVEISKLKKVLNRDIKVCFVTARKDRRSVQIALNLGGDDYIVKPIDGPILLTKIKRLFGGEFPTPQFAEISIQIPIELKNFPLDMNFEISKLSESEATIEGPAKFKIGSEMILTGETMKQTLNISNDITCKILSSDLTGELYNSKIQFLGMSESDSQCIRKITINTGR